MNSPTPSAGRPQSSASQRLVNLALQGGGSHGAFTWGVLDALLEDGRLGFDGISGTSAGAMNAVALGHGLASAAGKPALAARDAAREALANFWNGVVDMGRLTSSISQAQRAPFGMLFGGFGSADSKGGAASPFANPLQAMNDAMTSLWSSSVSPYQSNPMGLNPLRNFLNEQVDFERLAAFKSLKIFVVATAVTTGKAEIFSGKRLTVDSVMASACLPTVFQAVEIEGQHYWDGGYSGNPAIHPLIYNCSSRDIVLVQINPIEREELPKTAADILNRLNEITFNAALIAEMRAIDFVKRLLAEGKLDPTRYKDVLMHRIDGGELLEAFHASTKSATDQRLIHELRDLGIACAKLWLKKHFGKFGKESSLNIARDYLDDLRVKGR